MKQRLLAPVVSFALLVSSLHAQGKPVFNADTRSAELRGLAAQLEPDVSKFGCGPLTQPGRTYYVSLKGDDKAAGTSWATAWRTVRRGLRPLEAGDTLLIGEGLYEEPYTLVFRPEGKRHRGAPGRPIRIMAAPNRRVLITGAWLAQGFRKVPGKTFTWRAPAAKPVGQAWESDTLIELQYAGTLDRVEDTPASFWRDEKAKSLYVRFSDSRGPEVHAVRVCGPLAGMVAAGSYVHLKGLRFLHYSAGLFLRPERRGTCDHITVEECAFFANGMAGMHLMGEQWCLIKNNYGEQNGERGSILSQGARRHGPKTTDSLITGNRFYSSAPTLRTHSILHHFCFHHWGGIPDRLYLIGNLFADRLSCWWKPPGLGIVVQGNVMLGSFNTTGTRHFKTPADRFVVRGNTILGAMGWASDAWGPGGPGGDWAAPTKAFVNNFFAGGDRRRVAAARFADPAYDDYRLQSDSPLIGKALGGGDRGAYRRQAGRVLYVSAKGRAGASGTCDRDPIGTLAAAASRLRAGDTLYVARGKYPKGLVVDASGTEASPILIRARGKREVRLPSIVLKGSHVTVEGFTVAGAAGDGVVVRGSDVTLRRLLVRGARSAGVRAVGADRLALRHCTLTGNAVDLALDAKSRDATVRDCVIASPRKTTVKVSADSGYLGSNNCYGAGVDPARAAAETDSVVGDPLFLDPARSDYRLRWDSPAASRAAFAHAAGARTGVPRTPEIRDARVVSALPDAVSLTWRTPLDDCFGGVHYRVKGAGPWRRAAAPGPGTFHGAGVEGLKPATEYEYRIVATGRRGGSTQSEVATFRTAREMPEPAVYYVVPKGSDEADGRSPATAWRTLRKASQTVAPGDTVRIGPGVYTDPIIPLHGGRPGRCITFAATGDGAARLYGGGVVAPLVHFSGKNHMTVRGLAFDIGKGPIPRGHLGPHLSPGGVFQLSNCKDVEILRCRGGLEGPLGGGLGSNMVNAGGCEGLRIEGNVCWGSRYALWLARCSDVVIRNNTIVRSRIIACIIDRSARNVRIVNNIWYRPCGPKKNNEFLLLRGNQVKGVVSDYNLYFSPYKQHTTVGKIQNDRRVTTIWGEDLAVWRKKTGHDRHSVRADPLFVDVKRGDFRLKPGSPAIGRGEKGEDIGALGAER